MRKLIAAFAAVVLLALTVVPTSAAVILNETVQRDYYFASPCTGDSIILTGTFHQVVQQLSNSSTLDYHYDFHLTGVGSPSGNPYVLDIEANEMLKIPPTSEGTTVITIVQPFRLISTGSLPDEKIKLVQHVTVTPDPSNFHVTFEYDDDCTG